MARQALKASCTPNTPTPSPTQHRSHPASLFCCFKPAHTSAPRPGAQCQAQTRARTRCSPCPLLVCSEQQRALLQLQALPLRQLEECLPLHFKHRAELLTTQVLLLHTHTHTTDTQSHTWSQLAVGWESHGSKQAQLRTTLQTGHHRAKRSSHAAVNDAAAGAAPACPPPSPASTPPCM